MLRIWCLACDQGVAWFFSYTFFEKAALRSSLFNFWQHALAWYSSPMSFRRGFTLIELMLVIMILGILAAVGIPTYKDYALKARMSEAYTMMDKIRKSEIVFYTDHREFHIGPPLPDINLGIKTVPQSPNWETVGYPTAIGNNLNFSYRAVVGRMDETGTELNAPSATYPGNVFTESGYDPLYRRFADGGSCNTGVATAGDFLTLENNTDWVIITATADLNYSYQLASPEANSKCTSLLISIQSSPSSDKKPNSTGIVIFNYGD